MSEQSYGHLISVPALASIDISGANASRTRPFFHSFRAVQAYCLVTTAVSNDDTITLNRETKYGVATDDIAIGTFVVPVLASGVGTLYVMDLGPIADTELAPGEGISFTATGGGVGVVWCGVSGYEAVNAMPAISGLTQANQSKLPTSAQGTIRYLTFTAS